MMITIQTVKSFYIEDFLHHAGRWRMKKTLIRVETTFKGTRNLSFKILYLLGEFGFGFFTSLEKAIASSNIDIIKMPRERDRDIAWIQIDGLCYKIIDYSVL